MIFSRMEPLTDEQRKIVDENTSLVWLWIRKINVAKDCVDDAFQYGAFGLMKAAQRFDPSLGFEFSTYAGHWIKVCLRSELRFRVHRRILYAPNKQLEERYWEKSPTIEVPLDAYGSMNTDSGNRSIGETIPDTDADNPEMEAIKKDDNARMIKSIAGLPNINGRKAPPNILRIIARRHLIGDDRMSEIGRDYGITREGIRQLKERAVSMLRKSLEDCA